METSKRCEICNCRIEYSPNSSETENKEKITIGKKITLLDKEIYVCLNCSEIINIKKEKLTDAILKEISKTLYNKGKRNSSLDSKKGEIISLRKEGLNWKEIAPKLGIKYQTLIHYKNNMDLE